jgi:hypothetical protein
VHQGDAPVTYRAGDVFNVSAGNSHTEEIGAEGAKIMVGRSIRGRAGLCQSGTNLLVVFARIGSDFRRSEFMLVCGVRNANQGRD